jgi:branched-chain amino acid transport system permease protein
LTTLYSGLVVGAIYALVAIGYNVVLLASGVFNFAYGAIVMISTYMSFLAVVTWGLPWWLGIIFSMIACAVVAVIEEAVAIRPLFRRGDTHAALVTTVGASTIMAGVVQLVWGPDPQRLKLPIDNSPIAIFGGVITPTDLALIIVVVIMGVGLHVWSRRSLVGISALSIAESRTAAAVRGINTRIIGTGAFALSGALAGATGLLVGARTYAIPTLGNNIALFAFVAIAIGGMGSILAGMAGGFIVGLVFALTQRYVGGDYATIAVFLVLLVLLLTRPNGLFGRAVARSV